VKKIYISGGTNKMQIPFLDSGNAGSGRPMAVDKNDQYVLKNCLAYLKRHFKRFPSYCRETCKMLVWTLGTDTERFVKFLMDQFERKNRLKYKKELMESDLDADDYAGIITKMLPRIGTRSQRRVFQQIMVQLEIRQKSASFEGKSDFEKNIMAIKEMFSLTDRETEFIVFLFIVSIYEGPQDYFVNHLECQKIIGQKYLANILGVTKTQLHSLLTGKLKKIGIIEVDNWDLKIEDEFLNLIQNPKDNNFSQNFYFKVKPGTVPLENYFFKKERIDYMLKLLENKPDTSTHILLYGLPGTGKTSFAYSLKKQLNIPAYEIVQGDENTASKRRAAILACLNLTNTGDGSLMIVDEADNILNTRNSWLSRGETQDKGWLNGLLETPGVRIIWITNDISGIEDSVLRRFAFSLHFKMFNRRQRIELWNNIVVQNKCKRFFKQADIETFAKKYNLSAGVIDLAVKKSKEIGLESKSDFHQTVEMALEAQDTLHHYGEKPVNKDRIEKKYTLEGLSVQGDLESMIGQLETFDKHLRNTESDTVMNMNLLFYGPPGTGKSELARYIGNRLDREIICKRMSELQSMYVGEGEKNIKQAFAEAEAEEAVLIIDEADSLLFSRDRAVRSWEISFTNEFLTQMERFRGVLVCTTNRLADLDPASLRRFNFKVGFDYLTPGGNVTFYDLFLRDLTDQPLNEAFNTKMKSIRNLAPGDFKVVRDRYLFHPKKEITHEMLLDALETEAKLKSSHGNKKPIGF
jgi:transitional endoplasmic reticulum ATPase